MKLGNYWDKSFSSASEDGCDRVEISKISNSDWANISIGNSSRKEVTITIRSRQMAESLHFMLGQLLSGEK